MCQRKLPRLDAVSQGKYDDADSLYLRALEINEKAFGPDHPDVATTLNNRAMLLETQVKNRRLILEGYSFEKS